MSLPEKHRGLWSWSFVGDARKGLCGMHVSLWKRQCVISPPGQSRNRNPDKMLFFPLRSIPSILQPKHCTQPFPGWSLCWKLASQWVLLLIQGSWNKMQLSSSFRDTQSSETASLPQHAASHCDTAWQSTGLSVGTANFEASAYWRWEGLGAMCVRQVFLAAFS